MLAAETAKAGAFGAGEGARPGLAGERDHAGGVDEALGLTDARMNVPRRGATQLPEFRKYRVFEIAAWQTKLTFHGDNP